MKNLDSMYDTIQNNGKELEYICRGWGPGSRGYTIYEYLGKFYALATDLNDYNSPRVREAKKVLVPNWRIL